MKSSQTNKKKFISNPVYLNSKNKFNLFGLMAKTVKRLKYAIESILKKYINQIFILLSVGESPDVGHLVFIVHGIGSVCDMKFRSISEVVDGFRELAEDMSQKHFQSAHLSGKIAEVYTL